MSEQELGQSINFKNFADWCLHKDTLSEEARYTIEVLLDKAGTSDINKANRTLLSRNRLSLEEYDILNITPLQSLTHLTYLNLNKNKISDVTPLQSLTNLTYLELCGNQISEIASLQSLTNLTALNLNCTRISDITPLQSLTNLTNLELGGNQISDITSLQSLTNLTVLHLNCNRISDITPLQSLTNLTNLELGGNQISDITPLQSLTNLTVLHLGGHQISNIIPLQFLTNLTNLALSGNQISDITPLQSLTNLVYLDVNFTSQHKTQLVACYHKWRTLANSIEQIDGTDALTALKVVCEILGLETPEITFCSSPHRALAQLQVQKKSPDTGLKEQLNKQVEDALRPFKLIRELPGIFRDSIVWEQQLFLQSIADLSDLGDYWNYSRSIVTSQDLVEVMAVAEFCFGGLDIVLKPESLKFFEAVKQLLTKCGWIFAFENSCIICDRPIKLSLDSESRLHAEGESAIEFADGYKLYSYHGVTLPEKYGAIHPESWQSQWLLEEENAELRRVLIQGIGYARICQELQATELDSWQEYTLLRIDADIDGFNPEDFEGDDGAPEKGDIYLLKMTCPSTGFIHALRVPPEVRSAREAIRWVNWDIDSEEFSVQT